MARLIVLPESPGDQPLELTDKLILVGREPDNLLQIEDPNVSKHHALLVRMDDTYQVFDLHSANGTYVNDARINATKLNDGDVIRFGPDTFRFETRAVVRKIGLRSGPAGGGPMTLGGAPKPPAAAPTLMMPKPTPPPLPATPPPTSPKPTPPPLPPEPPKILKAIPRGQPTPPVPPVTPANPSPAPAAPVAFPAGADAKETAAAVVQSPATPPANPTERTLKLKPTGGSGEIRLRLKR